MRSSPLTRIILAVSTVMFLTLRMLAQTETTPLLKYLLGTLSIAIILAILVLEIISFKYVYLYLNSATLVESEGLDMDNDFEEESVLN